MMDELHKEWKLFDESGQEKTKEAIQKFQDIWNTIPLIFNGPEIPKFPLCKFIKMSGMSLEPYNKIYPLLECPQYLKNKSKYPLHKDDNKLFKFIIEYKSFDSLSEASEAIIKVALENPTIPVEILVIISIKENYTDNFDPDEYIKESYELRCIDRVNNKQMECFLVCDVWKQYKIDLDIYTFRPWIVKNNSHLIDIFDQNYYISRLKI